MPPPSTSSSLFGLAALARACLLAASLPLPGTLGLAPLASAASRTWHGLAGSAFSDPANWDVLPADDLLSDLATFSGPPAANQPSLTASRSVAGLVFSTPSGGWTLATASPSFALSLGASGLDASAQSSGTTTVSADLSLAATQTWSVGSTGTVLATGSVRLGSSAAPLAGQLVVGGSSSGDLVLDPAPGRSVQLFANLASAAALQVNRRLVLGSAPGSTASVNAFHNTASAGIRISNTGVLVVRSGEWRANDLGSNNTGAFTGTLDVSGGVLAVGGARYLGQFNGSAATTVHLSGGSLVVTGGGHSLANSGHLGLGAHFAGTPSGTIRFNVSGGTLEVARGAGNFPAGSGIASAALSLGGVAHTTVLFDQSGGAVRVGLASGSHLFTGAANGNTFTNLSIGSNLAGNRAAYTLSGGSLLVAGSIQGLASAGGVSNFNFLGGTLAAAGFNAAHLGHSPSATADSAQTADSVSPGTLVNRGGVLSPGGEGVAGRSAITGDYLVASASAALSLDLGGPAAATVFQHGSGAHDTVSVSGAATLGGDLLFRVLPGFTPAANASFTVLTATGGLSGSFANAPHAARVVSADGLHTFVVSQSSGALSLGQYAAVLPPSFVSALSPAVVAEGDAVQLGVTVNSLAPVAYEWRRDGVLLPGASSSSLTLPGFQSSDAGLYEVAARNAAGTFTRSFLVRVTIPPSAVSVVLDAGASRTFSAAPGAVSYQWILDGESVAATPSFTYAPARREVGSHWLRLVETYADNSVVTRHWTVRVRLPVPASATFLHVSPSGSDTNAGTAAAPFRTLEKARDTIRAFSPAQRSGGVTVYLRGGVHARTSTFTLSAQDSGTEAAPVIYAAFPGESPVLTSSRSLASSAWAPLAASEHARLAPGVNPARLWETSVAGNPRAAAHPAVFNEWVIFNALRSSQNGGLFEVFRNGERLNLSRYPNPHPTDDTLTPNLLMDGVATGADIAPSGGTATGFLNVAGTYTFGAGGTAQVGGAFHYSAADAARVARWQTALSRGGLWLAGYWRVPWQLNGVRVSLIDPDKRVIGLVTNPSNASAALVSNGVGDKYTRPAGNKKEPWFALNLLEEIDLPGEWSVDFSRQRLYVLLDRDGPPADGEIELSDQGTVLFQLNGASDVVLRGLTFRRHLGINVQILNNASRNLVLGCRFIQSGNMAVDINGGVSNGVLSSDFEKLASGGVMLRGGSLLPDGTPVPADHFAVNNKFRSFGEVIRVYQAAVDVGYGGPMGNWGLPTVGMRVAHNDVRTSPHAGILWNGHRHIIEYNEVSDFTRISNDLGAIYRFGRNADFRTVIRYNHLHDSPLGEGVYNDMDHVRTPVYGNTVNLKTPASAQRGYGFWSNTHTTAGEANSSLPMGLQVFNNVFVNTRSGASFHSATGGRIENNLSYRPLGDHFRWFRITNNTTTNTHVVATSNAATLQSGPNLGYASDPGFIDYAADDLRLRPDAQAYRDLPGFVPVPLELAGLRADETRPASDSRPWTPFVVTGDAYSVGLTSATFSGTLVYPQFDPNAVVRIHYGTTDGGVDPAAWQHVAVLGQPGSGHLAHTRSDLLPGTRYFFRFHAENAAGEHWAERSNFTTTFASAVAPDTAGPVLVTPGNLVVAASGSSGATVNFEVSAEDALAGYVPASVSPASGSLFPIGVTLVTVTAADPAGNSSAATFTITVNAPSLPAPWSLRQINPFSGVAPGSVTASTATSFTIVGAGGASTGGATADLWTGTSDSNTYLSQPWQGDGTFTARVASLASTDGAAKAGLIFRETTNAGSRYTTIYLFRNNGGSVGFQHKTATNGASTNTNFFHGSVSTRGIPEWLRLTRQGDTFTLSYSDNGAAWTQLSSRANAMSGSTLSVGLVVAPRTGGSTATATFDNISFLSPLQSWRLTHFGTTSPTGSAAPLADPDADGIPNLLAYALGRSPLAPSASGPAELDLVQTDESSATHLTLTFTRIADPTLTYVVEATSDLVTWTPLWSSTGSANQPGEVVVADSVELAPDRPRRFLRLRVFSP